MARQTSIEAYKQIEEEKMDLRARFGVTREVKVDGITSRLRPEYRYMVLILDTVEKGVEYELVHVADSLNAMGWCMFDDIEGALGKKNALKVVKYCEAKVKKVKKDAKDLGLPSQD